MIFKEGDFRCRHRSRAFFLGFLCILLAGQALAQRKVVQFSGLVVTGEQSFGVPYASVFVPKTSRGAVTNDFGFFSFPLLAGDTCLVRSQGFRTLKYVIPHDSKESISRILYLNADTTLLPAVEILPFPTEEDFKRAFLSLKLPEGDLNRMRRNLDNSLMARMQYNLGMDAGLNHMYFQNQQTYHTVNRNFVPTNQLINPFAWSKFIQSVKRGDLKKRRETEDDE